MMDPQSRPGVADAATDVESLYLDLEASRIAATPPVELLASTATRGRLGDVSARVFDAVRLASARANHAAVRHAERDLRMASFEAAIEPVKVLHQEAFFRTLAFFDDVAGEDSSDIDAMEASAAAVSWWLFLDPRIVARAAIKRLEGAPDAA